MESKGKKRVLEEFNEIESKPSIDFECRMLDNNPLVFIFAFRGCKGSDFELGIYHGQFQFSENYPSEPPTLMLLTPNGRFKTRTKIGLKWQPSWRARDAILALIRFMDSYPDGELGSVEYNEEERRVLAMEARAEAPKYGPDEYQSLIDENHKNMLLKAHPLPVPTQLSPVHEHSQNDGAKRKHSTGGGGGSFVRNLIIGNSFHATNSNGIGFLDSMNEAFNEGPTVKKPKSSWFSWRN